MFNGARIVSIQYIYLHSSKLPHTFIQDGLQLFVEYSCFTLACFLLLGNYYTYVEFVYIKMFHGAIIVNQYNDYLKS